jgi:uncharacterized coiled-coil DUF342 family protein
MSEDCPDLKSANEAMYGEIKELRAEVERLKAERDDWRATAEDAGKIANLNSVQVAEHQRLTRQLNMCQYLRGIAEGSNARLRRAIEGSLWLAGSMQTSGRPSEQIVFAIVQRLTETLELDARVRTQEGLFAKDDPKAIE